MKLADHEQRSLSIWGRKHTPIHLFLDQFFKDYGQYHRVVLHHQKGVELVVQNFGEEARKPAEKHIYDDIRKIPESWNDYNYWGLPIEYFDHFLSRNAGQAPGSFLKLMQTLYANDFIKKDVGAKVVSTQEVLDALEMDRKSNFSGKPVTSAPFFFEVSIRHPNLIDRVNSKTGERETGAFKNGKFYPINEE